jgi:hypothetical protein
MFKVLPDFKLCNSSFNSYSNTLQNVKMEGKLKTPEKGPFARANEAAAENYL